MTTTALGSSDGSPPPPPDVRSSRDDELRAFVASRATWLASGYLRDASGAVRALAMLRRAVGSSPGAEAEAWGETLGGMPRELQGVGDAPSVYEIAAHLAITVFAVHQQSKRAEKMHQSGRPFGGAIRALGQRTSAEEAVLRRFHGLGTAGSIEETAHHLRSLVTQLRGEGIALDYGQLAVDLRRLQAPATADGVRLRWGREYYRSARSTPDTTATTTPETPDTAGER